LVKIYRKFTSKLPNLQDFQPDNRYLSCDMKKVQRTRVVVSSKEKLTVWRASQNAASTDDPGKVSIECPHCGKEAFSMEIDSSSEPEIPVPPSEPLDDLSSH